VGPPAPPFVLAPAQLQYVQQVLQMWETESSKVNTFNSDFERWEYDAVWNPGSDKPMIKCKGVLSYSKPDKGSFKIDEIKRWTKKDPNNASADAPGDFIEQKDEVGEHWVCDGKAVYEYEHRNKELRVTPIPEALRGKSIVDGPLPFLFGADAKKLMDRYWINVKKSPAAQIWLEAYPRRQADALNYDYVEVMLDRKTMQPTAIQVHLPGGQQRHVYMFQSPTVNGKLDALWGGLFSAPRTPIGWKKVVVNDGDPAPGQQAANPAGGIQR
jgi:TIGR03009 family protein